MISSQIYHDFSQVSSPFFIFPMGQIGTLYNTKIFLKISQDFSWFLPRFLSRFLMISLKFLLLFFIFSMGQMEPCTLQRFLSILFNISHDFFPDFSPDFSRFLKVFSHLFSFPVGQVWTQVQYKNWEKTWSILSSKEDLSIITSHMTSAKDNFFSSPFVDLFQSSLVSIDNNKCQRQTLSVLPLWRKINVPSFLD